jgi:hypothetical protein
MSVLKIKDKNGLFLDIPAIKGMDGKNGEKGDTGATGANGLTPTIGENGNWFIGDTDTGKPSRGEKGEGGGMSREEVEAITGKLENLTTEDKTNLVTAINEVNQLANDPKLNMPIYYINIPDTSITGDKAKAEFSKLITEVVNNGDTNDIILIMRWRNYLTGGYWGRGIRILESCLSMSSKVPKYAFRIPGHSGDNLNTSNRVLELTGGWTDNVYTCNSVANRLSNIEFLSVFNTTSYTPTKQYHPATKDYVDRTISNAISTSITSVLESEF